MPIYYVRSSGGNDSNDGLSFAQSFSTIQKLIDTLIAGDVGIICNDGIHSPSSTINFNINAGTTMSPIYVLGASATGELDGSTCTISGSSLSAGSSLINLNISANTVVFQNIRFTAGKLYNIYMQTGGNYTFNKCRIDNAVNHGIYHIVSSAAFFNFESCEIDHNGGSGYAVNSQARGKSSFYYCSIHHNVGSGILDSTTTSLGNVFPIIENCLIYKNATGISFISNNFGTKANILYCTIFGNTSHGINLPNNMGCVKIARCIISSNGGYGIFTNTGSITQFQTNELNNSYGNTSGNIDINSDILLGENNIYEDPSFINVTDGSENLVPRNTNLYKSFSFGSGGSCYEYIGALEPLKTISFLGIKEKN